MDQQHFARSTARHRQSSLVRLRAVTTVVAVGAVAGTAGTAWAIAPAPSKASPVRVPVPTATQPKVQAPTPRAHPVPTSLATKHRARPKAVRHTAPAAPVASSGGS